jgi:hypothetical protein
VTGGGPSYGRRGVARFARKPRLLLPAATSWLDSGMNKRETRAALLLMVIGLIATWSNAIFRGSEILTWIFLGVAAIALVLGITVLVKSLRRQQNEYWNEHHPSV